MSVPEVVLEANPPNKKHGLAWGMLWVLVVLVVLGIIAYVIAFASVGKDDEAGQAYYAAKKFCERYAPSATKFTTEREGDYLDGKARWVTNNGRSDWYACGYVDCQNRYGAMKHQFWGAHVKLEDHRWKLTYLAIGQETIVGGD